MIFLEALGLSCTSAKFPEPSTKFGIPLTEDAPMSGSNGENKENKDPQIVVLDHAKMERRKRVPEQSDVAHAAPAYAKKEQIALTSKFSTRIQQK